MGRIRSTDTTPELRLRRRLWAEGLRYRLGIKTPGGRPDLVFPGVRIAVFIDGCFWHGCPRHYVSPRTSIDFWARKLVENVERDRRQTLALEDGGWTVLRFWEHEVWEELDVVVTSVRRALEGSRTGEASRWHVVQVVPLDTKGDRERRVMQSLRDQTSVRTVDQARTTEKWKAPSD
jgi:DNA mismatch endonuclease, patch repair protein